MSELRRIPRACAWERAFVVAIHGGGEETILLLLLRKKRGPPCSKLFRRAGLCCTLQLNDLRKQIGTRKKYLLKFAFFRKKGRTELLDPGHPGTGSGSRGDHSLFLIQRCCPRRSQRKSAWIRMQTCREQQLEVP